MQIRQEIGINISKHVEMVSSTKSKLGQAIESFFLQEHVTRVCPDKDKYVIDENTSKEVQLRYRLGPLRSLHQTFCVENIEFSDCCLASFVKYVPCYVVKPRDQDWGTCLCMYCTNPQLKLERFISLKIIDNQVEQNR